MEYLSNIYYLDILNLTNKLTDCFVQYEEAVVGMVFKAHMERFVMDIKKANDSPLVPELVPIAFLPLLVHPMTFSFSFFFL